MTEITKVILADDHPIVREGLMSIIKTDEAFSVMGSAENGQKALHLIEAKKPDIAVLDISMPGPNGLDIAKQLSEQKSKTRVVILTMYRDSGYFDKAMALGIPGYILKDSAPHDLLHCLRTVRKNGSYISPLLSEQRHPSGGEPILSQTERMLNLLTRTEKNILRLMAENHTSKEIGERLFISFRTVQNHRFNMSQKLNFQGHHKLLHFAIKVYRDDGRKDLK